MAPPLDTIQPAKHKLRSVFFLNIQKATKQTPKTCDLTYMIMSIRNTVMSSQLVSCKSLKAKTDSSYNE